jgi:hypothetical protein
MKEEVKLMAEKINAGTILIKEGTLLPEGVQLESDPYLKGWKLVKSPGSSGIDLKLREAGWTFFYMAGEVDAMAFGSKSEKTTQRAVQKVIAKIKLDTFNCVEISQVAAKGFLGLPIRDIFRKACFCSTNALRNGIEPGWPPSEARRRVRKVSSPLKEDSHEQHA